MAAISFASKEKIFYSCPNFPCHLKIFTANRFHFFGFLHIAESFFGKLRGRHSWSTIDCLILYPGGQHGRCGVLRKQMIGHHDWLIDRFFDKLIDWQVGCTVVAAFLHYFLLSLFSWMLCEGVLLYILLVKVFGGSAEEKVKYFYIFGWGRFGSLSKLLHLTLYWHSNFIA